jgi:hypothetical protein
MAPLYIVTMENCTEEEAEIFYRACERLYEGLECDVAWVLDTTNLTRVSARQRRISADHVARTRAKLKQHVAGCGFVIPNVLIRGVLIAITWLTSSLPFPYETFDTRDEAILWARNRLNARQRERGLPGSRFGAAEDKR